MKKYLWKVVLFYVFAIFKKMCGFINDSWIFISASALNGWHYVLWLKAYKEKNSFTQICNWKREVLVSSRKYVGNLGSSDHTLRTTPLEWSQHSLWWWAGDVSWRQSASGSMVLDQITEISELRTKYVYGVQVGWEKNIRNEVVVSPRVRCDGKLWKLLFFLIWLHFYLLKWCSLAAPPLAPPQCTNTPLPLCWNPNRLVYKSQKPRLPWVVAEASGRQDKKSVGQRAGVIPPLEAKGQTSISLG